MIKNNIKALFLILFICLPSIIIGQTGGISKDEKKQLEERFKALKTFYIDDDGLVVYTGANGNDSVQNSAQTKETKASKPEVARVTEAPRVKVKVSLNDFGEYVVTKEEAISSLSEHDNVLNTPQNQYAKDDFTSVEVDPIKIDPIKFDSVDKIDLVTSIDTVTSIDLVTSIDTVASIDTITSIASIEPLDSVDLADLPDSTETEQVILINKDADKDADIELVEYVEEEELFDSKDEPKVATETKNTPAKKTVSLKRKAPSKSADTTLAELDDLISQLRAQQSSRNKRNVNSLSNKISGGVDAKIRKDYSHDLSDLTEEVSDSITIQNELVKDEPVYYINGVKATKEEFIKLKPDEIRRKEVRRSKENPKGEWWIQTR